MRLLWLPAALAGIAAAVQTVVEGDFSSFALDPQSTSGGSTFLTRVVNGKAQLILQPKYSGSIYGSIFVPFPADATVGSAIKITTRFKVTNPGESFAANTNTAPMPADPSNLCTMYILNIYRPVGSNSMSYAYFAAGRHQPTDGVTYTETLPNRVVPDDPANSPMRFYWYASCFIATMEYQFEYLKVEFDVTPPVTTTTTSTTTEVTMAFETTATEETTITTETSTTTEKTTATTSEETEVEEITTAEKTTTTIEKVTTTERITTGTEETSITQGITTKITSSTDEATLETTTTTNARTSSSFSSSAPSDGLSPTSKMSTTEPSPGTTTEVEITPSPTSMTASSASSSTSAPADPPTANPLVPLGCYTAVGDFQNFRLQLISDVMTVDLCVEACQGQQFAGTYDQFCYCGSAITNFAIVVETRCDISCPGNSQQRCGGRRLLENRGLEVRQSPPLDILLSVFVVVNFDGVPMTMVTSAIATSVGSVASTIPAADVTSVSSSTSSDTTSRMLPLDNTLTTSPPVSTTTSMETSTAQSLKLNNPLRPHIVWSTKIVTEFSPSRPTDSPQATEGWLSCIRSFCEWDLTVLQPWDCDSGCDGNTLFGLICDGFQPGEERWEPVWCFQGSCRGRRDLFWSTRCLGGQCGDYPIVEEAACDECEGGMGYRLKPKDSSRGHRENIYGEGNDRQGGYPGHYSGSRHGEYQDGPLGKQRKDGHNCKGSKCRSGWRWYMKHLFGDAANADNDESQCSGGCSGGKSYVKIKHHTQKGEGHWRLEARRSQDVAESGSHTVTADTISILWGVVAGLVPLFVLYAL